MYLPPGASLGETMKKRWFSYIREHTVLLVLTKAREPNAASPQNPGGGGHLHLTPTLYAFWGCSTHTSPVSSGTWFLGGWVSLGYSCALL